MRNTLLYFFFFVIQSVFAGDSILSDTTENGSIIGLPIVYFSPETNWAFGCGAIYTFRIGPEIRPTSLQLGLVYTLKKQYLFYLPFQFYWDKTRYDINGELGYYKYNYQYFGIGNRDTVSKGEVYNVIYPRVKLRVLKKVYEHWFIGIEYAMDRYNVTKYIQGGILDLENPIGKDGGLVSSLGFRVKYDTRDNIFYSRKGKFFRSFLVTNQRFLGSPFSFSKFGAEYRYFKTNRLKHTLGFNFVGNFTFGSKIPFYQMSELGGNKMMRGFIEGEFRDKIFTALQLEYRLPLFWRLGMVGFLGIGEVSDGLQHFNTENLKYSMGAGLRILLNTKEHINMRIDVAWANNQKPAAFYITFGEAF